MSLHSCARYHSWVGRTLQSVGSRSRYGTGAVWNIHPFVLCLWKIARV